MAISLVIGRAVGSSHSTPPGHLWFAMAVSIAAPIATRSSGRKTWCETFSVAQPGQKKRETEDEFAFHFTVLKAENRLADGNKCNFETPPKTDLQ
jgi:hypothetical protein